jgi:antitoxin CcdA
MAMNRPVKLDSPKRATNISLSSDLVDDARRLGINVSEACQAGLAAEVKRAQARQWLQDNHAAINSYNAWVAENGLPYDEYRQY